MKDLIVKFAREIVAAVDPEQVELFDLTASGIFDSYRRVGVSSDSEAGLQFGQSRAGVTTLVIAALIESSRATKLDASSEGARRLLAEYLSQHPDLVAAKIGDAARSDTFSDVIEAVSRLAATQQGLTETNDSLELATDDAPPNTQPMESPHPDSPEFSQEDYLRMYKLIQPLEEFLDHLEEDDGSEPLNDTARIDWIAHQSGLPTEEVEWYCNSSEANAYHTDIFETKLGATLGIKSESVGDALRGAIQ